MAKRASCHYEIVLASRGRKMDVRKVGRSKAAALRVMRRYVNRSGSTRARATVARVCRVGGRKRVKLQERCLRIDERVVCQKRVNSKWRRK